MQTYLQGKSYLKGLTSRFSTPPPAPITPAPPAPITPAVKREEKFSGYGLTQEENNLIASKLKEIREGTKVFVVPHLKKLLDLYLEDFDNITDASLGSYVVEGLIPMLTQSRVDLQYLEERGYDIRSIVERGEKRSEQKRKNQAKTRKNRKTRRR